MKEKIKKICEKKYIIGLITVISISAIMVIVNLTTPKISLESPTNEILSNSKENITIPVVVSNLPNNKFPAASASIKFDKNKLEFVGIDSGTMEVYDDYDEAKGGEKLFKIPQWSFNKEVSNQQGEVKTMYLDTTAGKNAYSTDGFKKNKKDIAFQLVFKLKDSVQSKDKININIDEAVFATVDGDNDKTTLSTKETYSKLKVKNAKIKIG